VTAGSAAAEGGAASLFLEVCGGYQVDTQLVLKQVTYYHGH